MTRRQSAESCATGLKHATPRPGKQARDTRAPPRRVDAHAQALQAAPLRRRPSVQAKHARPALQMPGHTRHQGHGLLLATAPTAPGRKPQSTAMSQHIHGARPLALSLGDVIAIPCSGRGFFYFVMSAACGFNRRLTEARQSTLLERGSASEMPTGPRTGPKPYTVPKGYVPPSLQELFRYVRSGKRGRHLT